MPGLTNILSIARRALSAQQSALNVTGHNIANANTPGFSRQRVDMETSLPLDLSPGQVGTGVQITGIRRIRDQWIDAQFRAENGSFGRWEYAEQVFRQIEDLFGEPGETGLNEMLGKFWNTWEDLANTPESSSARVAVQQRGITLTHAFNRLDARLRTLQEDLNTSIEAKGTQINAIAKQIAELNVRIVSVSAQGDHANDAQDERDRLIDTLSKLVNITTGEHADGTITIAIGGRVLVGRDVAAELTTTIRSSGQGGLRDVVWKSDEADPSRMTSVRITNGELGGILDVRDSKIPDYLDQLNTLASHLTQEINTLHRSGYGIEGGTGMNFFEENVSGAGDMALSPDILNDPGQIAASSDGSPGDNSNALAIAELRHRLTMNGGTTTFGDHYSSLIATIGVQSQEAQLMRGNRQLLTEQLENERRSVSGVSLDEEMTDLIKYQHAYAAAARLVTTMNDLMQTILDMI